MDARPSLDTDEGQALTVTPTNTAKVKWPPTLAEQAKAAVSGKIHMDIASNIGHLSTETILFRGAMFFAWMLAFMGSMALIGLIPTVPIFIIAYMRVEGREPWLLTLGMAVCTSVFIWVLFDWLLTIPWPPSLLGDVFPQLKWIPSV